VANIRPHHREPPIPVVATGSYELLPGGHFLLHHVSVTIGDQPLRAIEIIGEPDPPGGYLARSAGTPTSQPSAMSSRPTTPDEIDARLGAFWIDVDTVHAFLRERRAG
jgi:hypothetical protein